jgi:nitrite reductase/ring-hydroxylating ferredoxin subunit
MPDRPSVPTQLAPARFGRPRRPLDRRQSGTARSRSLVRCRHQLADLSKGSLDQYGCLVCPWHGARYDVDSGAMVEGPKGLLWYQGRTPGYTQLVKAYSQLLKLRRRKVVEAADAYVVQE